MGKEPLPSCLTAFELTQPDFEWDFPSVPTDCKNIFDSKPQPIRFLRKRLNIQIYFTFFFKRGSESGKRCLASQQEKKAKSREQSTERFLGILIFGHWNLVLLVFN
jgi:hypothetical protein